MRTYKMPEDKLQLSRFVGQAARGESLIIAKAEKLMSVAPQRCGFFAGKTQIPDDFDSMGATEIEQMFGSHCRFP